MIARPAHWVSLKVATPRGRTQGFTLIELMVTVAIVGILAALAYPSYSAYVIRSHRAAAESFVQEVSSLQQRYLVDARAYATSISELNTAVPSDVSSSYTVIITSPRTGVTTPSYIITATPINAQLSGDTLCGVLTLDETGAKTASGGGTSCW